MMTDVLQHLDDGVLVVTINRPAKKNALTAQMYSALADAIVEADRRDDIRVVLLQGEGGNFTSGNDIGLFVNAQATEQKESPAAPFLRAVIALRKPMVAGVCGHAVGIGATVLLHCDYVVASDDARIRFPFVDLGLCPEFASTLLLQQLVGRNKATEWLLLAGSIPAAEAHRAGLVNRVMPLETVAAEALSIARCLAAKPRQALMATRGLVREATETLVKDSLQREMVVFDTLRQSPEAQEIFRRFLQQAPVRTAGPA
ncbi:enoyl-CoA hydratase [Paraburkholderia sp. RL18-103-BIB-C]|jgi:enoyl-CoA hydratase/carnithine racemase|uniref:enoyl-CoA hydratase n=1 Tax=unclassified Paraburkholderia TaxID=2615204 RepID=UPI0038B8B8AD